MFHTWDGTKAEPWNAHKWAYLNVVGPVPEGKELDHLCRVRGCVKVWADEKGPAHIEAVPHRDNCNRGTGASARNLVKTHCPQGHLYDEANTYHYPDGSGRKCRACHREEQARYKAAKRLA
jgi:hypothetical protein